MTGAFGKDRARVGRRIAQRTHAFAHRRAIRLATRDPVGTSAAPLALARRTERPRARLAIEIADDLIANPILSVADAHRRYGRTNQANRDAIGLLVELGVLEPYRDAPYDRLFWSPRVFAAIR